MGARAGRRTAIFCVAIGGSIAIGALFVKARERLIEDRWIEQLGSKVAGEREEAREKLMRLGSVRAIPALISPGTSRDLDPDDGASSDACGDICARRGAAAVPTLLQIVSEGSPAARFRALEQLAAIGPVAAGARGALEGILAHGDRSELVIVVSTLVKIGVDPQAIVPRLTELLAAAGTPSAVESVLDAIARVGPLAQCFLPQFVERLRREVKTSIPMGMAVDMEPLGAEGAAAIAPLLSDGDARVRRRALTVLIDLGEEAHPAIAPLAEGLQDRDEWVCLKSADALGAIGRGARGAAPALVEALHAPSPALRERAAAALVAIDCWDGEAVPALLAWMDSQASLEQFPWETIARPGWARRETAPILRFALREQWRGARISALRAALAMPLEDAPRKEEIQDLLADPEPLVRHLAECLLARSEPERKSRLKEKLLREVDSGDDSEGSVDRSAAAQALGYLAREDRDLIPAFLEKALGSEDWKLAYDSLRVAGLLESEADPIVAAFRGPNNKQRSMAEDLLRKLRSVARGATPALAGALHDPDPKVRVAMARALSLTEMEGTGALPALRELLEDQNPSVRIAARKAIRSIEDR